MQKKIKIKNETSPCCQKRPPGFQKLYALLYTAQLHEGYNTFVTPLYPPEDNNTQKIHDGSEEIFLTATYCPYVHFQ